MTFCVSSYLDGSSCNELFSERVRCVDAEIHKLLSRTTQEYEIDVPKRLTTSAPNSMTYTPITRNIDNNLASQNVLVNGSNYITCLNDALEKENLQRNKLKTNLAVNNDNNQISDQIQEQIKFAVNMKIEKVIKESVANAIQSFIDEHIDNYIESKIETSAERYMRVLHSQLDELRNAQRQWIKNMSRNFEMIEQRQRHLEEVYNTDIKEAKSALEVLRRDVVQQMERHTDQIAMRNDEVKSTITSCKVVLERNERQLAEQRSRHESQQLDALTSMEKQVNTWISEYDKLLKQEQRTINVHKKETMTRLDKYDDALTSIMLLCSENANNVERVMYDALAEHSDLRRCALDLNRIEMMLLSLSNDKCLTQLPHANSFLHDESSRKMKADSECKWTKSCASNRHSEALWCNESKHHAHDNLVLVQEMMRLKEDVQHLFEIVQDLSQQMRRTESNKENVLVSEQHDNHKDIILPYKRANINNNISNNNNLNNNDYDCNNANCVIDIPKEKYNNTKYDNHQSTYKNNTVVNIESQRTPVGNSSLLHKTWPARYSTANSTSLRTKQCALSQLHRSPTCMLHTENKNRNSHLEQTSSLLPPPQPPLPSSLMMVMQSSSETQQYVPVPTSDSESERENLQLSRLALD